MRWPQLGVAGSVFVLACGALWLRFGDGRPLGTGPAASAEYVGSDACSACHEAEASAWRGSHHDLAMQVASTETVLGDFDGATFEHLSTTATFTRRDERFIVRTDGPDGTVADFEVAYAFGVEPLQQYLIELAGGRLHPLTIAWDTRPAVQGGQRWFHLYPDEPIVAGDPLHWTSPGMSWNYMCAECHSTAVSKGYAVPTDSYQTTWAEIDVGCEACHGPGSRHLELGRSWAPGERPEDIGLAAPLTGPAGVWRFDAGEAIASRGAPLVGDAEIDTCAHCHARRATIEERRAGGTPIHDSDVVSLLAENLYHPDGQILDEVYVFGSFVQSKMYSAGVRCSDCHDAHTLEPRAPGNALCAGCHLPSAYDVPQHHRHPIGSQGAQCVACHMPTSTYMVVDARRDHSMRVPRPDLTERLGVPNACSGCHEVESAAWATAMVESWHGERDEVEDHFAVALHAGREGLPGAARQLRGVVARDELPGIARASAISLLGDHPSQATFESVLAASLDGGPFVRRAALEAMTAYPAEARMRVAFRLLRDSLRAVRIEAARVLAPLPAALLTPQQQELLGAVSAEYIRAQMVNADRPSSHVSVGNLHADRGMADAAEASYRTALALDSTYVPAYLNLADLYRVLGRDDEGEDILRRADIMVPRDPTLQHAIGLLLVRLGRVDEALRWLATAAESAPGQPRFAYVLGVGLNSAERTEEAIEVLGQSLALHPYDRDLLTALATIHRDRSERATAASYAARLAALDPDDAQAEALLRQLREPVR